MRTSVLIELDSDDGDLSIAIRDDSLVLTRVRTRTAVDGNDVAHGLREYLQFAMSEREAAALRNALEDIESSRQRAAAGLDALYGE